MLYEHCKALQLTFESKKPLTSTLPSAAIDSCVCADATAHAGCANLAPPNMLCEQARSTAQDR
eukprot:19882-Heterococcus_DN1.PRE.3